MSPFAAVFDRKEPDITIMTRKNNENDDSMENLYIRKSKENYEWLKESIQQAEEGKLVPFEIED